MATSTIKNITPANIGAVNKAGDMITGVLTFESGNGVSWISDSGTQYILKRNAPYDNVTLFVNGSDTSNTWKAALSIGPDGNVGLANPLGIAYGGTGATNAALYIEDDYTSVLAVINAVRNTRIFPISVQKTGTSSYGDMPTGYETAEWNMELVGDSGRLTAFLFLYGSTGVYRRDFFAGDWLTGWTKIANLTPANIGAVAKTGDTMTGNLIIQTSQDPAILYCRADGTLRGYTLINDDNRYVVIQKHLNDNNLDLYYFPIVNSGSSGGYDVLTSKSPVTVAQGGTGATQGTIDITDYCIFPTGNVNTSSPYGGRLYYNPYLNCVFGTIVMNDNAEVTNQADIVYLRKDSSGTPLMANREVTCGVCVHSEAMPVVVPRITGSTICSSHITGNSINSPRYTIMAFLG